jgi:hypothetical protein
MSDVLDETQPWPISIPEEPSHDRCLEARDADGRTSATWKWNDHDKEWVGFGAPDSFYDIVAFCGTNGWTLRSTPDAIAAGAAAMLAKQKSLPPFAEPRQEEWRRVFEAGLDAYHEAGGGR